jgi:hypothetical protein
VHLNSRANSSKDVLNLVEPLYARDIRELFGSQQNHFGFYGYISSMKRRSNDDEWKAFCRKLYFRVTTACKRLQKRPVTETHPTTMPVPQQYDAAGSPRSRARSGTGYSSRFPAPPSPPPPHQGYARSSTLDDTPSQPQQTSEPRGNHNVSQIDDNVQNRTSLLKEHVDSVGGILDFKENMASSDPVTWRCVATLDDLFSEGTGRSKKEAKHAASKEMCIMLGLSMD